MVGKYESWLLDSFVQGQSNLKFCPTPQCSSVIQCAGAAGDVVCRCGGRLCWLCDQGGHHPAPCDLVRKWKIKERSDDANEIWLRARTKECPKCSVRIEKNKACNHMTCSNCSHQFCWLCKGAWNDHGTQTGGFYACTKYNDAVSKGKRSSEEKALMDNQRLLQKYTYYYKRYKSMTLGVSLTLKLRGKIEADMAQGGVPLSEYSFILAALDALVDSRRVLQFTNVLAYYIRSGSLKTLFEYQQQQLTESTEMLQDLVETKTGAELLEIKSIVINRLAALARFRGEMEKRVEAGEFDNALLGEADGETDIWGCGACGSDNPRTASHCVSCAACQLHGEMECKGCVRSAPAATPAPWH